MAGCAHAVRRVCAGAFQLHGVLDAGPGQAPRAPAAGGLAGHALLGGMDTLSFTNVLLAVIALLLLLGLILDRRTPR